MQQELSFQKITVSCATCKWGHGSTCKRNETDSHVCLLSKKVERRKFGSMYKRLTEYNYYYWEEWNGK